LIRSMTGFGLGEAELDGLTVRVEIRSVNHRFLQARFRLPSEFADLEPRVDALVKKNLSRGAVTLTVNTTRSTAASAVTVDEDLAGRYLKLLTKTAKRYSIEDDLKLSDLVGLPGVVTTRPDSKSHLREGKVLLGAVGEAIERLLRMRETEGSHLEDDIRKQGKAIEKLRVRIEKRMPKVIRAHFEGMKKRADNLLATEPTGKNGGIERADLARELALLAERTDVSEEISRLDSHIGQVNAVLEKGGEVGRKLDFLVQELYREANTIGSKAGDAKVAHAVVELKTHIERVREQVQNVE